MVQSLDEVSDSISKVIPKPRPELLQKDIKKAVAVVDRILSSPDHVFNNRKFLLDCFHEYGLPLVTPEFFKPWAKYMNQSGFGALQVPTEAVDFLRRVTVLNIGTAVEIGTYRGGMSYFMAAVLQRARADFVLTLVDPWDSLLGFEEMSKRLNLRKEIPSTSSDFAGKIHDLVFIDGDHTFEGAMLDYRNLGKSAAKAVALHDIHDHGASAGTVQVWDAIKLDLRETHEVYEIAHSIQRGLGIGLAIRAN